MPKYTFLLPAYKGKFLDEMLSSIQEQTYNDFRVIISDDCSPDPIYDICKPYLSDPRFSYRRNSNNIGGYSIVHHWNILVDLCDSDYLIIGSDDDLYEPIFLEEIEKLTNKHREYPLIRARVTKIDENGEIIISDSLLKEEVCTLEFVAQSYKNSVIKCISNYVFKTSVLKSHGGFIDFPLAWFSDTATVIREAEPGCINTSMPLFKFRMSGINVSSRSSDSSQSFKKISALALYDTWLNNWLSSISIKSKRDNALIDFIKTNHADYLNRMINYDIYNCNWADFKKCCKRLKQNGWLIEHYYLYYLKWKCWKNK